MKTALVRIGSTIKGLAVSLWQPATNVFYKLIASSGLLLTLLSFLIILMVVLIINTYSLKVDQIIVIIVGFSTAFLALFSQRATLREDQRQKMRYQSYKELIEAINNVENALAAISVDQLDNGYQSLSRYKMSQDLRYANSEFTNTYHAHEMVFVRQELLFMYLHFSMMKLTKKFDGVESSKTVNAYGDVTYGKSSKEMHNESKDLARDIASWLYDLKKLLIRELGFAGIFHVSVGKRKPLNKKYKTLDKVATQIAVNALERESLRNEVL